MALRVMCFSKRKGFICNMTQVCWPSCPYLELYKSNKCHSICSNLFTHFEMFVDVQHRPHYISDLCECRRQVTTSYAGICQEQRNSGQWWGFAKRLAPGHIICYITVCAGAGQRNSRTVITKIYFLKVWQQCLEIWCTRKIVKSAFQRSEIYPFDPTAVDQSKIKDNTR